MKSTYILSLTDEAPNMIKHIIEYLWTNFNTLSLFSGRVLRDKIVDYNIIYELFKF